MEKLWGKPELDPDKGYMFTCRFMKAMHYVLLLTFLVAALGVTGTEPTLESVETMRQEAYAQLRKADAARDRREWGDAVYLYHDARNRYQDMQTAYPDWDAEYLAFRIAYCTRQLETIGHHSGRTASEWLNERLPGEATQESDEEQLRALYQAALERIRYLEGQVNELEQELDLYLEMEELEAQREQVIGKERAPDLPTDETNPAMIEMPSVRSPRPQAVEIPQAPEPEPDQEKPEKKSWLPWR